MSQGLTSKSSEPAGQASGNGIDFLSSTAKQNLRRVGDVNPPLTVRNRAGIAASGLQQVCYRPIDIGRSP
ncbi:MAG UNVERIFIED_CONTAM: hypothetical protein LVR18_32190 [Planctomycetaceae bacterium]